MPEATRQEEFRTAPPDSPADYIAPIADIKLMPAYIKAMFDTVRLTAGTDEGQLIRERQYGTLATIYGLSHTDSFASPEVISVIEKQLDETAHPERERFWFAYALARDFTSNYNRGDWQNTYTPEQVELIANIEAGTVFDSMPEGTPKKPGDDQYIGPIPQALRDTSFDWFIDELERTTDDSLAEAAGQILNRATSGFEGEQLWSSDQVERILQVVGDKARLGNRPEAQARLGQLASASEDK